MNYLPLLPTYLYLFPTEFLPTVDKSNLETKFADSKKRLVDLKDITSLILAVTLSTLKKKGLLLIQGNGNITFLKKIKDGGGSNLEVLLLKQIDVNSQNLEEVIKKINEEKIMDLVKADLVASEVLVTKKNLLGKEEIAPSPAKVTLLASQLPQVTEELEKLKADHLFLEVLAQTKKAMD